MKLLHQPTDSPCTHTQLSLFTFINFRVPILQAMSASGMTVAFKEKQREGIIWSRRKQPWGRHSCALTPPMATPIPWPRSLNVTERTKDTVVGPLLASSLPTLVFLCACAFLLLCFVSSATCSTRCLMDVDQTLPSLLLWRCQDFHLLI